MADPWGTVSISATTSTESSRPEGGGHAPDTDDRDAVAAESVVQPPDAPRSGAPDDAAPDAALLRALGRRFWQLSLPGLWVAVVFVCASLTPSVLPRPGMVQGVISGITGAIGYGIGVFAAWFWRECADRGPRRPRRWSWVALAIGGGILFIGSMIVGQYWQRQSRQLVEVGTENLGSILLMIPITVVVFALLLTIARGARWLGLGIARTLGRWIGRRAAHAIALIAMALLIVLVATGWLVRGIVAVADGISSEVDDSASDVAAQPTSGLRSGGPGSLVPWGTLGFQGRTFVGYGPTVGQLTAFNGQQAKEPIRAYAGIKSIPDRGLDALVDLEQRAELAADDLERAGGFDRSYLLVAGTTGTGWVDPGSLAALEYVTNGDVATVAIQYSYLPSWASIAVDRDKAEAAGRALFSAVHERLLDYPEADRPALLIAGESLGSDSIESAFNGEGDLRTRIAGGVLAGPPGFNRLHEEFTWERDWGSSALEPIYRAGRTVRFSDNVFDGIEPAGKPWTGSRVLYLQHASDPVLWIDFDLLWQAPESIDAVGGHDINPNIVWLPIISFFQISGDMLQSVKTPPGHGHKYSAEYADAWAAVIQPPGWTAEKTVALRDIAVKLNLAAEGAGRSPVAAG